MDEPAGKPEPDRIAFREERGPTRDRTGPSGLP